MLPAFVLLTASVTVPLHSGICSTVSTLIDAQALSLEPRACQGPVKVHCLRKEAVSCDPSSVIVQHVLALGLMTTETSSLVSLSLEMKQLLQYKMDLEQELETARESVKKRQQQEQAWR